MLPLPAWLVGALLVGIDAYGAMTRHLPAFLPNSGQNVAFTCTWAGRPSRWRITIPLNSAASPRQSAEWLKGHGRPPLKVFKPDDDRNEPVADDEVDRILTKIHREGEQTSTPGGRIHGEGQPRVPAAART